MKKIIIFLLSLILSFGGIIYSYQNKIDKSIGVIYSSCSNIITQSFYDTQLLIDTNEEVKGEMLNGVYQNLWQCEVLFSSIRSMNSNIDIDISYLVKYFGHLSKKKMLSSKDIDNLNEVIKKGFYKTHSGLYERDTLLFPPRISQQYLTPFEIINKLSKDKLEKET
jgi:hypothetical protein